MTNNLKNSNNKVINKKVNRKTIEEGKFTTMHHSILYDKRLTSTAYRILESILADSDEFRISYRLFMNRFGLGKKAVVNAFNNLEECGYVRTNKIKGHHGQFYIINECGNLNTAKTDSNVETVIPQSQVTEELPPPIQNPIKTNEQKIIEQHNKNVELYNNYLDNKISKILNTQNDFDTFMLIVDKHFETVPFDFYICKNEVEKFLTKIKTKYYNEALEHAEANNYHKNHKAMKLYKDWIKAEIFDKNNIKFKYDTMWRQFQQQNRKQDFETIMADRLEQMHCDGEGND